MIPEHTISGAFRSSSSNPQDSYQMYEGMEELIPSSTSSDFVPEAHGQTLIYHLSVVREKVQEVESLVGFALSPDPIEQDSLAVALSGAGGLIQDIVVAATSMLYAFQQVAQVAAVPERLHDGAPVHHHVEHARAGNYEGSSEGTSEVLVEHVVNVDELYCKGNGYAITNDSTSYGRRHKAEIGDKPGSPSSSTCDIVELDATDLLAKYTHYCQICGKGFKRDANLRMHMRAHGDEYKTSAALANPTRRGAEDVIPPSSMGEAPVKKYSCPQEGCRWNRKHAKFQPLKSMICVKNHYKRSHCPKMYVCNRCNRKQFSVLSDLRTHEKHCGDLKWMCSCGTTFSRKDKLMGHVALFVGHVPVINGFSKLQGRSP